MTPTLMIEGARVAPILGASVSGDRDGVAVLNYDGVVAFVGCAADAHAFIADKNWVLDWHCEIVENRCFSVGYEPF